jgi:hypothetical protein
MKLGQVFGQGTKALINHVDRNNLASEPRKSSRRTSLTIFNPQLTPAHLSSCSHNRSEPRYAPSPASGPTQLTITALLDRPCRETASYRHGNQTHFHHAYCYSSRFVRPHITFVTSSLPVLCLPNPYHNSRASFSFARLREHLADNPLQRISSKNSTSRN